MSKISEIILERENLRIKVEEKSNILRETIEIKDDNKWIPILSNVEGYSTLTFWSKTEIFSKKVIFERKKKKKLYYQLDDEDISLNLDYCLEENNILHIRYKMVSNQDLKLSKLAVYYKILLGKDPDYTWVPHIRPKNNLVMGDHIYRSPVIIYKKNNIAFALIPDLKTLGQNRPYQTFLDFNLSQSNLIQTSYVAFGFGNYKPYKHVYFKHFPKKEWNIKHNTDLTFRFYIISFVNKTVSEILAFVNEFFWYKYIRKNLYQNLEPQILPYKINVKESFKAIFERHKYWGDLKINNIDCGGFWGPSWLGQEKLPPKFINQIEINEYLRTYSKRHRIAVIFNTAWFLNIRSAYALRYFGEIWMDSELVVKSNKMLNLILELPRIKGVFPSLVLPNSPNTSEFSTSKGVKAWWHINYYNLVDTSLALYWAIKISRDFNIKLDLVKEKSKELVDLFEEIQLENGSIPIFIDFNKINQPEINKDLINSASSGAYLMFLSEYYEISRDARVIHICEKISEFIQKEIIPGDKWHDFEALYSCTYYSLVEYDYFTKSNVMNNLCIYWCAEGFLGLYKITKRKEYLNIGERILATLSLFQQVWDMSYISYNTFGGFGAQNNDAELGDAREGLFVKTYMQYYLETGKEEYMERGISALRACWALQLLSEYKDISPGNLQGIDTIDSVDRGCISENYGHSGRDERIQNFILFDWGNGTAATATAYVKKHFGDLFIDYKEMLVWGIDGLLLNTFDFKLDVVKINLKKLLDKKDIIIKARSVPYDSIEIIINDKSMGQFKKDELKRGLTTNIS